MDETDIALLLLAFVGVCGWVLTLATFGILWIRIGKMKRTSKQPWTEGRSHVQTVSCQRWSRVCVRVVV